MQEGAFDPDGVARDISDGARGWRWQQGALELADALGLEVYAFPPDRVFGDAELLQRGRKHVIHVRNDLSPERLAFSLFHEISHRWMGDYCIKAHLEEERKASAVAAALQMPVGSFLDDLLLASEDLAWLARKYGATQTAAALRFGEVTGRSVAVITPARVRFAGQPRLWPDAEGLRQLAARGVVRAVPLTDEPNRLAIVAA